MKLIIQTIILILFISIAVLYFLYKKPISIENVLKNFPSELKFYQYSNGKIIEEKNLSRNDNEYVKLLKILKDNKDGWKYEVMSYAPEKYFVGKEISINVKKNIIVINDNTKKVQFIHNY